jgi:hypothetical protein
MVKGGRNAKDSKLNNFGNGYDESRVPLNNNSDNKGGKGMIDSSGEFSSKEINRF